jgi:eukaryotic-like serine/threonine-protein kinase
MGELRERLQAALGDAYRIERELGGGGMSRVFLAQETALKRQVVVKVLPPEMAAGVNIERFRREIQLAASLQHPHIVPLHAAGQAGDLLYYTMPLVEGESLRAKLAREGELPVSETIRILADVADALAYAHAHGVVHRDIKPDNVLLSGKHAVVTDFGVSKAVSASSGGSLTSLGVALGTPAYMAPEQAAADPHVDHRADLYALGVLGYEMLTGRPPFTAATPQAMLAAQVTKKPEPVTAHREAIPPALNTLVMRCLEKHPADRWQNGTELLQQLEAMATPSGGVTPTGSAPYDAVAAAAAARAHPLRVAGLFALSSVAVLGVVYFLMNQLGLPGWVMPWAIGLLVVGLPIVVTTGLVERRRALARTTGRVAPPTGSGWHGWLTWRKALGGGVAAFATLGLGAGVYTAMRVLGIGPVGTLVASGVLERRDRLVLADFTNRTPDTTLGRSLGEAFRVDLAQSPVVRLLDASAVADALRRMNRAPAAPLDLGLARELAQRQGAKAVVLGTIDPVGRGFVLSAELVAAADGRQLVAVRENAKDDAAIIDAIDRLSKQLRERIGESLRTIRASEPLEQVTTGSLEALRTYTQGVRAEDAGEPETAIALLREATALDTSFAMAYRKLAVVLDNSGASREQVVAATRKAFEHRDRLPEVERYLAIAYFYSDVDYDPSRLMSAYRSVLERDPENTTALNNLSLALTITRRWAEAETLALRATALGPGWTFYNNALWAEAGQGHWADVQATLDRFARVLPHNPRVLETRTLLAAARGDYVAAEQHARTLQQEERTSPFWRARTSTELFLLHELRGRLREAEQDARDFQAAGEQRSLPGDYLGGAIYGAWLDVRYRNRPAAALKRVEAALRRHPLASMPAADRPYVDLARLYARAGRPDEAKRLLAEFERNVSEGLRRGVSLRYAAAADIALLEGRTQDAITGYRAWYDENEYGCPACGLLELADAYDKARQPDSTVATYERIVSTPGLFRLFNDSYSLPPTFKQLGELYEARGDRAKALEYYGRFVDLWKGADPELQPVVRDVRARLARLAGEH